MSDERIDFSSLDFDGDPDRMERMVGNVMWRARAELARRKRARTLTPVEMVAGWFTPAIAAAAAIAAISLTAIATTRSTEDPVQAGAYMSGNEVPASLTGWYEEGSDPTASELLVAANGGDN